MPDLPALARLVVKDHVLFGGLPAAEQGWTLALARAAWPHGKPVTEPQANLALKAVLAGPLAFLDMDHVELRRWLVDLGWLQRDGYGRAYAAVPLDAMPDDRAALAGAMAALPDGATGWVAAQRPALAAQREARRQAWALKQAGQGTGG